MAKPELSIEDTVGEQTDHTQFIARRDGRVVPFKPEKIRDASLKAGEATGQFDRLMTSRSPSARPSIPLMSLSNRALASLPSSPTRFLPQCHTSNSKRYPSRSYLMRTASSTSGRAPKRCLKRSIWPTHGKSRIAAWSY